MAERITLIQVNRDKHDEIISCIVRQDATGVIKEFKKDDVKKYIGSNVWKVDRLFLSTDGKLRVREKDTLIDDYIDACKLIGIEPLSIQKQGNEYIVYDIPKCKNIQIPGFVTKLYVSKDVRCNVQSQQAQSESQFVIFGRRVDWYNTTPQNCANVVENNKRFKLQYLFEEW